ncbi:MAG: YqgE/AlgH family protein [Francisellaceae bacterium]
MITENLTNQFLVATPRLTNTEFGQSVILMCQDNNEGAMGLVINKPVKQTLKKVFKTLKIDYGHTSSQIINHPIHIGGPLKPDNIFVLHTLTDEAYDTTIKINDDIAVTLSSDILHDIADNRPPKAFMVVAGYASWAPEQLVDEIKENDWLSAEFNEVLLFSSADQNKWRDCLASIGISSPARLSHQYGHA